MPDSKTAFSARKISGLPSTVHNSPSEKCAGVPQCGVSNLKKENSVHMTLLERRAGNHYFRT